MKRTLAIGDIHGCLAQLEALSNFVDFSPGDVLVPLGDYVDRGPDSMGVIDFLIDLKTSVATYPLKGNHEVMMLKARDSSIRKSEFLYVGGRETLRSYGTENLSDVPDSHWDFLENLLPYHEVESHLFVHANLVPLMHPNRQPSEVLFWEPIRKDQPPHMSGKTMICGHTPQQSGRPLNLGHAVCIDTGACFGDWLTCLDVESGFYWQVNEKGEKRSDFLDDMKISDNSLPG